MGEKNKHHIIRPEMRDRLAANRSGKLTPGQWLDIVIYPAMTLLVLSIPLAVVALPFVLRLAMRLWLILPVLVVVFGSVFLMRGIRYARAPLHFAIFKARSNPVSVLMFWKSLTLYDEAGKNVPFKKLLAPRPILRPDQNYMVYYLKDHDEYILLSIAPADHPDAERWRPDGMFETRFQRRSERWK